MDAAWAFIDLILCSSDKKTIIFLYAFINVNEILWSKSGGMK
jgi:hypothetical protein